MAYGLGRGLSALIPGAPAPSRPSTPSPEGERGHRLVRVAPVHIHPNPKQPRQEFRQEELDTLASSIRQHGILQPLVVTARGDGEYELVVGERRLRAAILAGTPEVPVLVHAGTMDERTKLELAIIENVQRKDLNPIERALAYHELQNRFTLTQDDVAARIGVSRSAVAHGLRLLALPVDMQDALRAGAITEGHGKLLASMTDGAEQRAWFTRILEQKLPVAAVAAGRNGGAVPAKKAARAPVPATIDPNLRAKALELQRTLGAKVEIIPSGRGGEVIIAYSDAEELAGIVYAITHG